MENAASLTKRRSRSRRDPSGCPELLQLSIQTRYSSGRPSPLTLPITHPTPTSCRFSVGYLGHLLNGRKSRQPSTYRVLWGTEVGASVLPSRLRRHRTRPPRSSSWSTPRVIAASHVG